MELLQILVLAIVQGAAELLPVSSSAHVIVAEKLMGLDPTAPRMTLLLVMLHTGTMFAVILYFWRTWRITYFASRDAFFRNAVSLFGRVALRYFGAPCNGSRSHFATVLRDKPVSREISRSDFLPRRCNRRILPIMSMVITPRSPLLNKAAG
jgi:hypothetical protein